MYAIKGKHQFNKAQVQKFTVFNSVKRDSIRFANTLLRTGTATDVAVYDVNGVRIWS